MTSSKYIYKKTVRFADIFVFTFQKEFWLSRRFILRFGLVWRDWTESIHRVEDVILVLEGPHVSDPLLHAPLVRCTVIVRDLSWNQVQLRLTGTGFKRVFRMKRTKRTSFRILLVPDYSRLRRKRSVPRPGPMIIDRKFKRI